MMGNLIYCKMGHIHKVLVIHDAVQPFQEAFLFLLFLVSLPPCYYNQASMYNQQSFDIFVVFKYCPSLVESDYSHTVHDSWLVHTC